MADKVKKFGGLSFRIDRPKGYVKSWPQTGWTKTFTYPVDYGYLPRHTGEDEEGLDFFVGDAKDGHLESFQKLRRDEHGRRLLDETKFLVGVTDAERETIYRLYGDEVWHRKVYKDMGELLQDLPKFKAKKKSRYTEKKAFMTPELYDVLMEKDAINFGRIGDAFHGVLQHFQGHTPTPTMLAPMKTPNWHAGAHAEMLKHYLANRAPGASQVELMAEKARQMGYHELGKAQSLGDITQGLHRLGISPQQQLAEAGHLTGAQAARQEAQGWFRQPGVPRGQASMEARMAGVAPTMRVFLRRSWRTRHAAFQARRRAKIAVLARYGFKQADAKFADIDKKIMGEIEVTGPNPADWAFSRMTGPQLLSGAETSSTPGASG